LTGVLLPELLSCLVLLSVRCGSVVRVSRAVSVVGQTLELLDQFNQLAPGKDRDDHEDLAWPGVWSKCGHIVSSCIVLYALKWFH
jgi:E3 ubiquitin-protein ligase HERC2